MMNVKHLVLGSWFLLATVSAVAGEARMSTSGQHLFTLGGVQCGVVKSVSGGEIGAPVIGEAAGPSSFTKKHIGPPRYDEFTLQVGWAMSDPLYDWIAGMWKNDSQRLDGSIIAANFQMEVKSERQFQHALLTEVTIPAMNGSEKDPGYLTVKFAPEVIRNAAPGGKVSIDSGKSQQKHWIPSNFRLEIDGLDCGKVSQIDSFTVKRSATTKDIGEARDFQKDPGKLEFPNLKITLAGSSAASWIAWLEDFVIKDNSDESKEKAGTLTLLGPNLQEVVARIRFFNLGICRLRQDDSEAGSEQQGKIVAELYAERMEFQAGKALDEPAAKPGAAQPDSARSRVPLNRLPAKK